jgi:hypothetical protein
VQKIHTVAALAIKFDVRKVRSKPAYIDPHTRPPRNRGRERAAATLSP